MVKPLVSKDLVAVSQVITTSTLKAYKRKASYPHFTQKSELIVILNIVCYVVSGIHLGEVLYIGKL